MDGYSYDCNFAAELVLDLAFFDGIGTILLDHLAEIWVADIRFQSSARKCRLCLRLIPILMASLSFTLNGEAE